ncbi:uncharacterized protein RHIMIDRAFT_238825 [Rhizopus microsporus ATCC 52813]|uniref:PiggyBac transposable element-derived protein domain-containing protein n=1 Tax=Rhizopus microsporus ATCC 52813 TaxID=1340429 RepID=A0A2G4SRK6_RHIZD|nr:uncharacterized protein RHIMIDRAFT_238825 [Rhizopus microsporus ATCC 52813]PHZ11391.1 hypothetical protein RHIMIDRAFT_238825 [Rhizopus microsporus ATCC 52813]
MHLGVLNRSRGSVDAANNLRDNLTSYHDIISTERWEMRFFGFFLSLCEANAYSSFRVFSEEGASRGHSSFKDNLAFNLLEHCKKLKSRYNEVAQGSNRMLRSDSNHSYVSMSNAGNKRKRSVCRKCKESGTNGKRVEKFCSCDPTIPLCFDCHNQHLKVV